MAKEVGRHHEVRWTAPSDWGAFLSSAGPLNQESLMVESEAPGGIAILFVSKGVGETDGCPQCFECESNSFP